MKREPSEEEREKILSAIAAGDRIRATSMYISITECGLTEAQEFIKALKEQLQTEQREQKERLEAQRRREEKVANLTGSARELPRERAIPVPPREEKAPLWQTPKVRGILAACAGVAIAIVALIVVLSQSRDVSGATKEHPFVNGLGMRFVPVPGTNVLFSVWETRVKDYQGFCDATGRSWEKPRFQQTADHPAVNVSSEDAKAFCKWLSEKEGKRYRLPTDHEWSCAVGIGDRENADATPKSKDMKIADVFPWGEQWPPPHDAGNYFGEECKTAAGLAELKAAGYDVSSWPVIEGFNDGRVFTAAAGSFRPNGLGIYDLGGNVWEWCQDEYEPGSASRVLRGGSWIVVNRGFVLSSNRVDDAPDYRVGYFGFRAVVEAGSGRSVFKVSAKVK